MVADDAALRSSPASPVKQSAIADSVADNPRETTRRSEEVRHAAPLPPTRISRLLIFVLGAVLVLSTLAYGTVETWALGVFQAGAALVVVLWVADAIASGVWRINRNLLQVPLLGLVVVATIQILPLGGEGSGNNAARTISLDPYSTLLTAIKTLALLIYFAALLAFVDSPRRLRIVTRFIIIFGVLIAVEGLIQSYVSPMKIYGIRETYQALPFGPFVHGHHFAAFMELALALPLGLLVVGAVDRDWRLLYAFVAVVMGIALIMTGSRGAMLSFALQLIFLFVAAGVSARAERRVRRHDDKSGVHSARTLWLKRVGLALALPVALLVGVVAFGGEGAIIRLIDTVNSEDPTHGRTFFWVGTLDIFRNNPMLGAGLGAFGRAYTQYDTSSGVARLEQAHNDYLQLLADTGIVGGVLGAFFLVVLFRTGWRRIQSADPFRRGVALGALAGCFAILVHSFFEFALQTTADALLFLMLAALATLGSQVEEQRTTSRHRRRRRAHND